MNFQNYLAHSKLDAKEYQKEGVDWCIAREQSTTYCRGGIIADEMGLGKTIMMIGTLLANFSMPNIIILPVILVEQWKEHFERTTGHSPLVYHGATKAHVTVDQLQRTPIVLTTYGTVLSDSSSMDNKLEQVKWTRIICDEAHHIRNRRTKIAKAIMNLSGQIKWLITGTPIQNRIHDLYSLFDMLSISNKVYTDIKTLCNIINTIVLRRTKKEVGILIPDLMVERVPVAWKNDKERQISEEIHETFNFNNKLEKQHILSEKGVVLSLMLFARQLCIYPALAKKHTHRMKTLGVISSEKLTDEGLSHNSKMDGVIAKIVERKDNENRKIIFTNFKDEIDHLKERLEEHDMRVEAIDGRINKKKREDILLQDLDVLILQIKTGNEGLNLQQYNEIYFVTPDWNPKMEEQAIGRCHRIGQTKPVHVFRFVMREFQNEDSTNNIEMYSEQIQEHKREIENTIMNLDPHAPLPAE